MTSGWGVPWLAVGSLAAGVATLVLISFLRPYRGKPGAGWFRLALGAQALFCLAYGVSFVLFDPGAHAVAETFAWVGLSWIGPLFLAFALEYTGRGALVRSGWFAPVAAVPVATTLLLVSPYRGLVWREFEVVRTFGAAVGQYTFGVWGYVTVVSGVVAAGIGVILLVETILSYGPLYRREATAVALSTVPPAAGLVLWTFDLGPAPAVNFAPILFLPHVLLDGYAFVGTEMFESNPTTRRVAERTLIDDLDAPVVVLDEAERIVDLNRAAERLFDTDRKRALGGSLWDLSPPGEMSDGEVLAFTADDRRREFLVSRSSLTGPNGARVGETVVLQDITHERQQRQRLEVLNRVLRHNLRNEMTVIQGYAGTIRSEPDSPEVPEWAALIEESGDRLTEISTKARDFEQAMKRGASLTAVDARDVLAELRAELETEFPDATVETTVELGDRTDLYTDRRLLGLVLRNLVENALEHNDGPAPAVTIAVGEATDGTRLVFEVIDNGPGIPESELAPLREEAESALRHGSGIGLWIAQWGTRTLDGDLAFRTEDAGTVVTVSLPRQADHGKTTARREDTTEP